MKSKLNFHHFEKITAYRECDIVDIESRITLSKLTYIPVLCTGGNKSNSYKKFVNELVLVEKLLSHKRIDNGTNIKSQDFHPTQRCTQDLPYSRF